MMAWIKARRMRLFAALLFVLYLLPMSASAYYPRSEDQPIYFTAADGARLAIYRYFPETPIPDAPPVIICPGVVCDHYFFDPHVGPSFARFLQDAGFDVWSLELRGHGNSEKPTGLTSFFKWRQTIDTYIDYDVPAAVRFVKKQTGRPQVFWIGHSRGGAIGYGHMVKNDQNDFAGAVMLAGLGGIDKSTPVQKAVASLGPVGSPLMLNNTIQPTGVFNKLLSYLPGQSLIYKTYIYKIILNYKNMDFEVIRYLNRELLGNLETNVFKQLITSYNHGEFVSHDGTFSYTAQYPKITRPLLCISGAGDQLITPTSVDLFLPNIGSTDKTHIVLSTANGYSADYGHADMLLGLKAEEEVFPIVVDWLTKHIPAGGSNFSSVTD